MATLIDYIDNDSDTTVIIFSGIGLDFGGIPPVEFMSLSKKYNAIYVRDDNRSWYNNIDVEYIKSFIKEDQTVITLGNSMGAFNACCFTNDYPVSRCIMFASQYSVHPKIVPFETRWQNFVSNIKIWKHPHLVFNNTTQYFIIQGNHPIETRHTDLMPDKENVHKFFYKAKHRVAGRLKRDGILHNIIISIIENGKMPI